MLALLAPAAAANPDLSGTWRIEWVAVNEVRIPILGRTHVSTRQVSVAVLQAQADGSWVQEHVPCTISATSDSSLTTTRFPPGFLAALPPKRYPVAITEDADGWHLRADTGGLAIGYAGDGAPVPADADDPRVTDWDADGDPGGTVIVRAPILGEVEVYVVQWSRGGLDGRFDIVDGRVDTIRGAFRLEDFAQVTIGASNPLFHTTPKARFLPERSTLVMTRVPDGTTCAELP